jgi:ribonuclease-3
MKKKLEQCFGFKINKLELFQKALTHRSYLNEHKNLKEHNERLEFLGDAVLELIVTEYLFEKYPQKKEGVLTSLRSSLVKGETLAQIAKDLPFSDLLLLSKGEEQLGGRKKTSLLANTVEAVIGAIYLDQGIEKARDFVYQNLIPQLKDIIKNGDFIDAKSLFQQYAQSKYKITPHYLELKSYGPDHSKKFLIGVFIKKEQLGQGVGSSKQNAEQEAAKDALKKERVSFEDLIE